MKKRIFTLLALAVMAVSNAWAASPTDPAISSLTAKSFTSTELLWTTPSNATTWYNAGWVVCGKSGGRASFVTVDSKKYTINPETDETVAATACEGLGIKNNSDTKTVYFCVTNVTAVDIYAISNGSSERTARMTITNSTNSGKIAKTGAAPANGSVKISADGLDPDYTYLVKVDEVNGADMTLYAIRFTAPAANVPTISSSPKSVTLTATESGVAVNSSFTITGSMLTPGTYNLNVPSVTGLSVSPTSFTVAADGAVSQEINVSYSSTENVSANSVNITATVDELNLSVAVNYSASVNTWSLQTISTETIWDFSKLSGGVQYSGNDKDTEHVYANIPEITAGSDFDATALAFTGEYPLRSGKACCQNGTLRFNTSVPGTIVVKFSDTGTSASASAVKRYLVVNGTTTEYWASRENNGDDPYAAQLNVTTSEIAVPAGDVTITGTSALVVSYLKFTPAAATTVTLNSDGYATFSSHYDVAVSGAKAYTAALDFAAETITCTEIASAKVPAGNGVLLYGDPNATVTLTPTTGAEALTGNNLKATTPATGVAVVAMGSNSYYVLSGDTFKNFTGTTFAANKAYFEVVNGSALSRSFRIVINNETTGIANVNANDNDNSVYDLQGRRVAQPTKGLYIVNGKKVMMK